jgi:signal transduction histidine kinase
MPTIEEPATIVRALAALRPLEPVLIGFAAAANEFSGTEIAADQQNLLRLHWLFSALAVVLILCGAALIVLLFIQHSAVRQAHRELRAATDDLRVAKDAAEAANETKSRFLANMSHELRTPLNAIIGFSEFMMMEPLGPLGHGKYRGYLSDILKSGKHMFELVTDILTMARLDAGRYELAPEPVALRALAEASIRIVEGTDMGKGRDIALAQPGDWPTLNVDDRAVRQMLINLVTNAVKFSDADTPVRIACRRLATGEIELTVTDRGIGMTARHIEMAVQPFQQIDSGMTRKYEGTGLGLSIVKALIEVHGGRLAIASTPGVGTEISLLFPARLLVEERLADVA